LTWNQLAKEKREEPKKKLPEMSEFWKPAKEIVHEQGLKILVWGREEVGKEVSQNPRSAVLSWLCRLHEREGLISPKTYFCLSAPPPVYVVDTEFGTAPVLRHFKDKEIYVFEAANRLHVPASSGSPSLLPDEAIV